MTVRQLIESLSTIEDQDIRVMVRGYEGGVNDMVIGNGIDNITPAIIHVALDVNTEWYYGKHNYTHSYDEEYVEGEWNAYLLES